MSPQDEHEADVLDRALSAVRGGRNQPAPPPFNERVAPRLVGSPLNRMRRVRVGIGAFACVAVLTGVAVIQGIDSRATEPVTSDWIANEATSFRHIVSETGAGANISVTKGTRLQYLGSSLALLQGEATFDMIHSPEHPDATFEIRAGRVLIRDRGTTFTVQIANEPAGELVRVSVKSGAVEAAGFSIGAGEALGFLDGRPTGPAWLYGMKLSLSLDSEAASVTPGESVVVRVVLTNPTDASIPWPPSGTASSPLHVEVTDPSGAVSLVRVTDSMLVDEAVADRTVPAHGRAVLRVRFDRTFASPGTYRLRAIFRPAEAVESPTSASISVTVLSVTVKPASTPTSGNPR